MTATALPSSLVPRPACAAMVAGLALTLALGRAPVAQAGTPASAPASQPAVIVAPEQALQRGLAFLLADQNADGSWGSHRNSLHEFWSNPETHRAWTVATTGLCVMALLDAGHRWPDRAQVDSALLKARDYLLANAMVKRPSDWDTDNTWAYTYGLPALVALQRSGRYAGTPAEAQIRERIGDLMKRLAAYQTPLGGWGYYDDDPNVTHPPTWATSFMTAVVILALADARDAGVTINDKMLARAIRAVQHCRLPSGAYTYSVNPVSDPRHAEWIDQVKGSLSRIAVCNLALHRVKAGIGPADLQRGVEVFFRDHRFLAVARMKPDPHEAYYANSAYFYLFGHYYCAQVIALLPPEQQRLYWPMLQREVIRTQQPDGAMTDWYLSSYHRPYGTAYGVMALERSLTPATQPAR